MSLRCLVKRMFIALELPEEARLRMMESVSAAREKYRGIGWVRPEGLHLTLRFLGDTDRVQEERIKMELKSSAARFGPMRIAYEGVDSFGRGQTMSVVWLGVKDLSGKLSMLADAAESAVVACGFPREARKFSPHITLGRVRDPLSLPPWEDIRRLISWEGTEVVHEGFFLYSSVLSPGGSIYTKEASFRFEKR